MTSCATSAKPILALNAAEARIQIVLGNVEGVLQAEEILCPGQSITHLPVAIARVLTAQHLRVSDLHGIACVRGPGSFTGLRIAHATMHGLARPHGLPMASLEYHALLAAPILACSAAECWIATYARKGHLYLQGFAGGQPRDAVGFYSVPQACALLSDHPHRTVLAGSAVRLNPELHALPNTTILPPTFDTPPPAWLLAAAQHTAFSAAAPQPLYLRKSDAEDNLPAIAQARGISEAQARAHLFAFD